MIHCAGVCDLDVCEARPQWAYRLNAEGTRSIREIFGHDAYILFVSTDLVFSGEDPPLDGYTEKHLKDPISIVGKTFSEAENIIFDCARASVVRLGLPLGASVNGKKGAIDWIESRLRKGRPVTLFTDEFRSCIHCDEISHILARLLYSELTGLYHLGGPRPWSLHEIGRYVLQRGPYPEDLLTSILRHQEIDGPPRVGNVALNSSRLLDALEIEHGWSQ